MKTIQSLKTNARTAGVLYLIIILCGLFSEVFVRSGIIVSGDATATANNIAANTFLFRIGFVSDLIMVMSDAGVALLFYLILKPTNKGLSLLASFFRLAQATVLGINLLNLYLPLLILNDKAYLTSFSGEQLNSLSLLFLNAHSYGYLISGVFFGLSCLVLGYLIYKARYFPKWLGILIVAAGASYLVDCMVNFLFPEFASVSEVLVMTVAVVSELSLCLFLLVKGIKPDRAIQNHTS
uniref:DUF4386 domain-containing protein n=1 Tax=uncultured Draconibacterium sp. TaxID=1573823 RepID=UPI0032163284